MTYPILVLATDGFGVNGRVVGDIVCMVGRNVKSSVGRAEGFSVGWHEGSEYGCRVG